MAVEDEGPGIDESKCGELIKRLYVWTAVMAGLVWG